MMSRKGLVCAAACAAMTLTGALSSLARAEEGTTTQPGGAPSAGPPAQPTAATPAAAPAEAGTVPPLVLNPTSMPFGTAWSSTPPLMTLLGNTPLGKPLGDLNITLGGYVEGSYTYQNTAHPPGNVIDARVFDMDNEQPEMNQLVLFVDRPTDLTKPQFDIGAHAEILYGTDGRFIHALGEWDTQHTQYQWDFTQLYVDVDIPVGDRAVRIRGGKFVTPAGMEVINPTGNQLYSHSFLFDFAIPFTHTGALATYNLTADGALQLTLGSTRGWDTSLKSYNDNWDGLGSLVWAINDHTTLTTNVIVGKDEPVRNSKWRELIDVVLTTKVTDRLALGFNGDYAHEDHSAALGGATSAQWFGAAGYVQLGLDRALAETPLFTLNARAEYFNDDKGVRVPGAIGTGVELFEGTIGVAITPFRDNPILSTLVFRPEFRFDYANKDFFNAGAHRYQYTAAIDAVYKF